MAEDVIPVYRKMLPLSTIIAPNWFEVEYVTLTPIVRTLQIYIFLSEH